MSLLAIGDLLAITDLDFILSRQREFVPAVTLLKQAHNSAHAGGFDCRDGGMASANFAKHCTSNCKMFHKKPRILFDVF
jgi:hypothetical protein